MVPPNQKVSWPAPIIIMRQPENLRDAFVCVCAVFVCDSDKLYFRVVPCRKKSFDWNKISIFSDKQNHVRIKPGIHIFKLDDGKLGILGFNNMVPVPDCALIRFDIDDETDAQYRALLYNQLVEIDRNRASIFQRSAKTYFEVVNKKNTFLCNISCDFKTLERASKRYDPNYIWKNAKPEA